MAREAEEDEKFKQAMLAKFAEEDRLEQLSAQRRRMKQLEHKKEVKGYLQSVGLPTSSSGWPRLQRDRSRSVQNNIDKKSSRGSDRGCWQSTFQIWSICPRVC